MSMSRGYRHFKRVLFFFLFAVLLLPAATVADEAHVEAEEHEIRHVLSLFLGVTDEGHGDSEFTQGLEYAYRVTQRWGVGGLVEYAGGDQRNVVGVVPFSWFPHAGWVLLAGPGVEFHNGRETTPPGEGQSPEVDEDETNFVFKVGAAYEFELGRRFMLAPTVNVDFVDGEEVLVYGLHFAFTF